MKTKYDILLQPYQDELIDSLKKFIAIDSKYDESTVSKENPFGKGVSTALNFNHELAIKDGFKSVLKSGADGIWGSECEEVCKKATLYQTKFPWRLKNLTKFVQSELGIKADGKFGADTHSAVIDYQEKCGFTGKDIDGIVGTKTYKKIVGV
jgi:peptidoglycan hydrolase-like protein with peptidoglycan-binding domain